MSEIKRGDILKPVLAMAAAAGVIATWGAMLGEHGSQESLGPLPQSCTIAAPKIEPTDYKPQVAERLLNVSRYNLRIVHFFAAACSTEISHQTLEHGVDLGEQIFTSNYDQPGVMFKDCVMYEADKRLLPADGTQLIMACTGLTRVREV